MADIVIWKSLQDKKENKCPGIVVKGDYLQILEEDYFQGLNYASWAGANFLVTTNLKQTRIFKTIQGKIPQEYKEIINRLDAQTITDSEKTRQLSQQTKAFSRDAFSQLLVKCHNIIRDNDKRFPDAALYEIRKILFLKIRYETDNQQAQIFSLEAFKKDQDNFAKYTPNMNFYQFLFDQTKGEFRDLFDPHETLKIQKNSFEAIIKQLEIYNRSLTSDDVKGIAFEKFIGKTFREEFGQLFTPRTVVNFMVEVLDPQEGEIIGDP